MVTGWTPQTIDEYIRAHRIRVVGIGCMTCEFPDAVNESRRLKSVHPGIQVVFGGAHPSGAPEECLESGVVDTLSLARESSPSCNSSMPCRTAKTRKTSLGFGNWTPTDKLRPTGRPKSLISNCCLRRRMTWSI